jgi:hypothetical protein
MRVKLVGNKKTWQSGISTLEVLIAMAIMVTTMSVLILVVFGNQTVSVSSDNNSTALYQVSKIVEKAKAQGAGDFNNLVASSSSDGIFHKKLLVNDINPCRKDITASISWSSNLETPQKIMAGTVVANPSAAIALGGDCGPEDPPTPFANVTCSDNDATFDFSPSGIPATGIDLIKRGTSRFALITGNGSSVGQDDFWVVNVNNRTVMQTKVSSLNVGNGLNDVDAAGNFAFVANNTTSKQLQIIDITALGAPDVVASVSLLAVGAGSEAKVITYYDGKVYVGTNYMIAYDEFQIFDVSDPLNPSTTPIGKFNVNHNIYEISVRERTINGIPKTLAYLAVSSTDLTKPELIVLDVTNPASITQIAYFNPSNNLYGTALYVLGDKAYLGRRQKITTNPIDHDFFALTIGTDASISYGDSAFLGIKKDTEVVGVVISGGLAFISTSDPGVNAFQVWNVANPSNIFLVTKCNYPQEATDVEFDDNYIYVVNRSQKALRVIYDNTNPFP